MKPSREGRCFAAVAVMAIFAFANYATSGVVRGAEDWPQFRGANSRGVADNPGLVDRWSASENVLWSQPIEGRAWSSPIVVGGRVFLTTVRREEGESEEPKPGLYFGGERKKIDEVVHEWQMLCFDLATGEPRWQRTLHQAIPATSRHLKNSYASETPVSDGERVYALFGDLGVYCLTLDGDPVWSRDLPPVATRYGWGTAASPVLDDGRLYIVCDNEEASYLLALDAQTGEQIFQVDRDEKSNWATPFVWKNELRTELITPGTGKVRSYDLEGNLLYEFGGCSSITIATPYADHGLLYVSSGYINDQKRPLFAIRPGASGDISLADEETSNEYIAWCQKQAAPYNPSTLLYKGTIYVLYDRAMVAAFDAQTGDEIYPRERIPNGQSFTASPWAANGRIYFLNEFGTTFVYGTGEEFGLLHTNELPEEEALYMATPAIAGDKLLIRSSARLYCIAGGK